MPKILIYDSIADGHHLDYIFYIIQQVSIRKDSELIVVCQDKIESTLKDFQFDLPSNVQLEFITNEKIANFHKKSLYARSISEWNETINLAQKHQVDQILFPFFDYFQFGALFGKKTNIPLAGILFKPKVKGNLINTLKFWMLKWVVNKPNFKNLFVLPEFRVQALQKTISLHKIKYLPDPIYVVPSNNEFKEALRKNLDLPKNKTIFLNFGHLDDRKGILEFLEGVSMLSEEQRKEIHLILAGKIEPNFQNKVEEYLKKLPNLTSSLLFERHSPETMQALFELTDWTLALYPKFMGSASMVIRSAFAGKPVLGSNLGAISHQISQNKLGVSADPENPAKIARALEKILHKEILFDPKGLSEFAQKHSVENFGKIVFENLRIGESENRRIGEYGNRRI